MLPASSTPAIVATGAEAPVRSILVEVDVADLVTEDDAAETLQTGHNAFERIHPNFLSGVRIIETHSISIFASNVHISS